MSTSRPAIRTPLLAVALASALTLPAFAITWDGGGADNLFTTAGNWNPDAAVAAVNGINGVAITFDTLAAGGQSTANVNCTGNSQTWTFNAGAGAMTITLNASQLGAATGPAVIVNNSPNAQVFLGSWRLFDIGGTTTSRQLNANGGDLTVPGFDVRGDGATTIWTIDLTAASGKKGTITGALTPASLTGKTISLGKNGAGTWELQGVMPNLGNPGTNIVNAGKLIFSAANTFSGTNRIVGGTLQLNHASALQSATLDMDSADAGTLEFGSTITATTLGGLQGSRNITLANTASSAVTLSVGNNNLDKTYGGVLSGTGGAVTKVGSGSLTLGGANTFSGAVNVNAGRLFLGVLNAIQNTSSATVANGAALRADLAGTYASVPITITGTGVAGDNNNSALLFRSGGATGVAWPGAITLSGGAKIGSYGVTYNTTLSGAISGTGPLTLSGQGGSSASHTASFTLSAQSSYTGATTFENNDGLSEIKLILGINNALPTTTALTLKYVSTGAAVGTTLDLNGKTQQLGGLGMSIPSGGSVSKLRVLNSTGTGSLIVSNVTDSTFDGPLGISGQAAFSLTKNGSAKLSLGGTSLYTGSTTVSNGTLAVTGNLGSGGNTMTVWGGTLAGTGTINDAVVVQPNAMVAPGGSAGTLAINNNLTLNAATLNFELSTNTTVGLGINDLIQMNGGTLNLTGVTILMPSFTAGSLSNGTYTLIQGAGTISGGPANFAYGLVTRQSIVFDTTSTPGSVLMIVSGGAPASLTWAGTNGNNWDLSTTPNWLKAGAGDVFFNSDAVTFDDTSANGNVTLVGSLSPGSIAAANSASSYVLSGSGKLTLSASLTKSGAGNFTLANAVNDYTGPTTVSSGTLSAGSANVLSPNSAHAINGGTLDIQGYNQSLGSLTLASGNLNGSSATLTASSLTLQSGAASASLASPFTKSTVGTVILTGNSTGSGTVTMSGGTLQVGNGGTVGALGSGNVSFTGSSTLAFNRTDAITVNNTIGNAGANPTLQINSGSVTLGGSGDNSGAAATVNANATLILAKSSSASVRALGGTATVNTNGALKLGGSGGNQIADSQNLQLAGGTFDLNGVSETIGQLNGYGTVIGGAATLTLGGTANTTGSLYPSGGTLTLQSGTVAVAGTWNNQFGIAGGGTLDMAGGVFNAGNYFAVGNGSGSGPAYLIARGGTINSLGEFLVGFQRPAVTTISGTATFNLNWYSFGDGTVNYTTNWFNGGTIILARFNDRGSSPATLYFNGTLFRANSTQIQFFTNMPNVTALVTTNGAVFDSQAFNISIGTPLAHDPALGTVPDGGFTKQAGSGSITLAAASTYTGPTVVSAGAVIVNGTLGTGTVTVGNSAALLGNGTMAGAVLVQAGALLRPGQGGAEIETLAMTNTLSLAGTAAFTLNRTNAQNCSRVAGLYAVTNGGTLTVTNAGPALESGDSFMLIAADHRFGAFATTVLPTLAANLAWDTTQLAGSGIITVERQPVAGNLDTQTAKNQALALDPVKLVSVCSDPDGDSLTLVSAGPTSTNGGNVTFSGGAVTYTPVNNYVGDDQFSFIVSDGKGGTATGTVTVVVTSGTAPSLNVVSGPSMTGGHFYIQFAGIPGLHYTIQYSPDLGSPSWTTITNMEAGTNGLFEFLDPTEPAPPTRYYRTTYP